MSKNKEICYDVGGFEDHLLQESIQDEIDDIYSKNYHDLIALNSFLLNSNSNEDISIPNEDELNSLDDELDYMINYMAKNNGKCSGNYSIAEDFISKYS